MFIDSNSKINSVRIFVSYKKVSTITQEMENTETTLQHVVYLKCRKVVPLIGVS